MHPPEPSARRTSKLALAALALGLAAFPAIYLSLMALDAINGANQWGDYLVIAAGALFPLSGLLAIAALVSIGRRPAELRGRRLALAGLVPLPAAILLVVAVTLFGDRPGRRFPDAEPLTTEEAPSPPPAAPAQPQQGQ